MKIEITQQVKDESEMADLLKRIAELIEEGYTSGYHPLDPHLQNLLWGQAQISRALGLDHPPYSEVSDEARSSSLPANEEFPCLDDFGTEAE